MMETLIYIALAAVISLSIVSTGWILLNNSAKQIAVAEINDNLLFVANRLNYYLDRSSALTAATVFDVSPGKLATTYSGQNLVFDTYTKTITLGGTNIDITKLRVQVGSAEPVDLTSDRASVDSFLITSLSGDVASGVRVDFSLSMVNPNNSTVYAASNSATVVTLFK